MQTKIKLLVFLALWRRPEITELCFLGLQRLRMHPDFDIQVLAVISEASMIPLCDKYNVHFVYHENEPLGRKKNFGLQRARQFEFDYLMEIGSDDLVLNELLDSYKPMIAKGAELFGINDAAYIDSETGACRRLVSRNSTYGAGRMISRSALEKMNFSIWKDEISKGMDNNSVFAFMRKGIGYQKVPVMDFPGVVDIKSKVNVWHFSNYARAGTEYDIDEIFSRISPDEVSVIKSLYELAEQD